MQIAGGKGLNVARAAHALGADVRAVALLRGHTGKWLVEMLAAEGRPSVSVWTHGENRASLSVADRETGGLTEFYEHGSEVPVGGMDRAGRDGSTHWTIGGWLTISGSMPQGAPDDGYRDLVARGACRRRARWRSTPTTSGSASRWRRTPTS